MTIIRPALVLLVVVAAACGTDTGSNPGGKKYGSAAEQLTAEFPGQVTADAVNRVLEISKQLTLATRSSGIANMVSITKVELQGQGKSDAPLTGIEDFNLGTPLDGVGEYDVPNPNPPVADGNPNKQYWECPPMEMQGYESCAQLVDRLLGKAKGQVDVAAIEALAKKMLDEDEVLKNQPQEFKDYALQYLNELALDIHKLGIEIGAIRAEYALRKAGLCDHNLIDGEEIAKLHGIKDAEAIIREMVGKEKLTLAPQGGECLKIGPAGAATQAKIDQAVQNFVNDQKNAMCPDLNKTNQQYQKVVQLRMDGIKRGITAHTTTIWVATFRNGKLWKGDQYVVANIDGCEAKDQITYTTSPLVVDLDNDGLDLSLDRVRFDLRASGQVQKTTWAGKREGFLALDLNKDGRITSGRELFGNHSLCGIEKCEDGAAALAMHDSNGDGKIDARDRVFSSLQIWVDANGDGQTQPGEMKALADHGIKSFSLTANRMEQVLRGGKVTLTLGVETTKGNRTAYDVWFDNQTSPGFQTPAY
jgi:hypothetical protein